MAGASARAPTAAHYVLLLLFLLNVLLVLDKIILTTMIEPIRREYHLSDLQLGALMGLVYALSLGIMAVPMGMWADRSERRTVAAICIALWSAMSAFCGFARTAPQLFLARIGVGVGEAGGGPAAMSLIADLYPGKTRATAMAVFGMGTPVAALANLAVVTQITHAFGWRASLVAVSVPGLLLALALRFTVSEPQRGFSDGVRAQSEAPPLRETMRFVVLQRSLLHLLAGATFSYLIIAGMGSWHFTFLVRSHHLRLDRIGPVLGVSIAVLGIIATFASGYLADRLARWDERYRVWMIAVGSLTAFAIAVGSLLVRGSDSAVALVACFAAMSTFWFATVAALAQALVQVRMRATIAGALFLLSNLIGYGFGPLATGSLSDALSPRFGADSLRYALLIMASLAVPAAIHFALAGKTLRSDLARAGASPRADSEPECLPCARPR